MRRLTFCAWILVSCAFPQDRLDRIRARLEHPPAGARIGIVVRDLMTEDTVLEKNADETFIPASNVKLLTTVAAWRELGSDFQFETKLCVSGKTEGGVLKGAVHVVAGADPNLSGRFFDGDRTHVFKQFAQTLRKEGIQRVSGPVMLHNSMFDREYVHPDWKGYGSSQWWVAPVGAFSFNDNCIDITVRPGKEVGDAVEVEVQPPTKYVKITNRAKTVAQKAQASGPSYYRAEGGNEVTLSGSMFIKDRPQSYSVAIHNPTSYFGTVLIETLGEEGIVIEEGFRETEEEIKGAHCVHVHTSKLMQTLEVTNTNSQNFYAEMLCKYLGYRKHGLGTWENGTRAILETLRPLGVTDSQIVDGCGLSRKNRVRPADLLRLLVAVRDFQGFDGFLETLAVSGGPEGTLKNRLKDERTRGRVKAKTGHLGGADALSGYLFSSSGTVYAFSILMNGQKSTSDARKLIDNICEDLLER